MKKTRKKVLGFLGLFVVAVMTVAAVVIPGPATSAITTVTDTIQVRVVGSVPDVNILGIVNNAIYTNPERLFTVEYENVEKYTVTLEYTDLDGNVTEELLDEAFADYEAGSENYRFRLIK